MNRRRYHIIRGPALLLLGFTWMAIASGCYHTIKPIPMGTDYQSRQYALDPGDIRFLRDLTYKEPDGRITSDQQIFDRMFELIGSAQVYILLDMFLFNSYVGEAGSTHRKIASELTTRLINKKRNRPSIRIDFITDPVNTAYGGAKSKEITALRDAGINVVLTDLKKMRDSNVLYSPAWRFFFQWFGNSESGGLFPHPFGKDGERVTLRSYLNLLNFKANHRKVFLADNCGEWVGIVTSANPHDGSSSHSNVGFEITGDIAGELYATEKAVAEWSGSELQANGLFSYLAPSATSPKTPYAQIITEKRIFHYLKRLIDSSAAGDSIDMAIFYLSERGIIKSLLQASARGAKVRLVLDPNRDAFGRKKNGIPNRQVASELARKSEGRIRIRWYDTHGEQFHVKMACFEFRGKPSVVILGSANFTKRNIKNYNLELGVLFSALPHDDTIIEIKQYVDGIWSSDSHTTDYSVYEDNSILKKVWYRLLEYTGFATF